MNLRARVRAGRAAFTLLELIVVITIIGTLSTIVVVRVGHFPEKARATKIKADTKAILEAAELIHVMTGSYPESLRDLVNVRDDEGRLVGGLDRVPLDPWGNEYQFEIDGDQLQVISLGADGELGGVGENVDVVVQREN